MSLRAFLNQLDPDVALLPIEFDRALVGFVQIADAVRALYDRECVVDVLQKRGLTEDQAEMHFTREVIGSFPKNLEPAYSTVLRGPYPMDMSECPACFEGVAEVLKCAACGQGCCSDCVVGECCGPCSAKLLTSGFDA